MAKIHGKGGSITWAGTANTISANITSWTVDATGDVAEITNMASAADWKEFLGGFRGWTASIETFWDSVTSVALLTDLAGAAADLKLEIVDAGPNVSGDAILTGSSITTDANDAVTVTYTFQGTGSLDYAAA